MKKQSLDFKNTGSVVNWLMANNSTEPKVGAGATMLSYCDRYAYEVLTVSKDLKIVTIQRYSAKRVDKNGMSECQNYEYKDLVGEPITVVWRHGKWKKKSKERKFDPAYYAEYEKACVTDSAKAWKEMIKPLFDEDGSLMVIEGKTIEKDKYEPINILWGEKREYYDFSF